jgi:hypothetical protein
MWSTCVTFAIEGCGLLSPLILGCCNLSQPWHTSYHRAPPAIAATVTPVQFDQPETVFPYIGILCCSMQPACSSAAKNAGSSTAVGLYSRYCGQQCVLMQGAAFCIAHRSWPQPWNWNSSCRKHASGNASIRKHSMLACHQDPVCP